MPVAVTAAVPAWVTVPARVVVTVTAAATVPAAAFTSSGTTLVRLPGRPIVSEVRDRASAEGSGFAGEHLPTAGIIEGATGELGESFEIQRRERRATQGRAGKVPKLGADTRAAVNWQDVDNVDLDGPRHVLPTRRTAADEPNYLVCDRGD
jgi:hypothetical protein